MGLEITWHTGALKAALAAAEKQALQRTADLITAQAVQNLKGMQPQAYAFGNLARSIGSSRPARYGGYMTSYIGFRGGHADAYRYAMAVERGRKPGKPPPYESLIPWVRLKLRETRTSSKTGKTRRLKMADSDARSKAFLVARAIGKRGTKPRPFMLPAFDQHRKTLVPMCRAILKQEMRKRMPQAK